MGVNYHRPFRPYALCIPIRCTCRAYLGTSFFFLLTCVPSLSLSFTFEFLPSENLFQRPWTSLSISLYLSRSFLCPCLSASRVPFLVPSWARSTNERILFLPESCPWDASSLILRLASARARGTPRGFSVWPMTDSWLWSLNKWRMDDVRRSHGCWERPILIDLQSFFLEGYRWLRSKTRFGEDMNCRKWKKMAWDFIIGQSLFVYRVLQLSHQRIARFYIFIVDALFAIVRPIKNRPTNILFSMFHRCQKPVQSMIFLRICYIVYFSRPFRIGVTRVFENDLDQLVWRTPPKQTS